MREENIICITCPVGCVIAVRGEGDTIESVTGQQCKRGEQYARNEFTHPVRILTTVAKLEGGAAPLVPVRSSKPVARELQLQCMNVIKQASVQSPIRRGCVVVADILGSGVDIIATCDA